jgi:hypothetical protein
VSRKLGRRAAIGGISAGEKTCRRCRNAHRHNATKDDMISARVGRRALRGNVPLYTKLVAVFDRVRNLPRLLASYGSAVLENLF